MDDVPTFVCLDCQTRVFNFSPTLPMDRCATCRFIRSMPPAERPAAWLMMNTDIPMPAEVITAPQEPFR